MAGSMPTYDYEVEKDALLRKQKIADAMLSQSVSPLEIQQVGPVASRVSPFSAAAKILQGYMAGKETEGIKKEKADLAERYSSDLSSGMQDFMRVSQGYEAPESPSEGAPMVQVPPDKKRAILEAIASNHPVLQALGMKQLESLSKGEDLGEVGGVVYDKGNRQIVTLGGAQPTQKSINGDLYELNPSTGQWKKLDNAPRINNTTNVSVSPTIKGEGKFMEQLGSDTAAAVTIARQKKQQAQKTIELTNQLEGLGKAGTFSGPLANVGTVTASFANSLGIPVDTNKMANSEAYKQTIMRQVADIITASGGIGKSFSDADREAFLKQFPELISSQQGRARIIANMRKTATMDIDYADTVQKKLETDFPEAARLFGVAPSNGNFPVNPATPAAKPMRRFNPATGRIE
jgi:hypothetical protein